MRRALPIAVAALAAALIGSSDGSAAKSPYYFGVNVSVEYGPTCHKDKYGGHVCGAGTPASGVKILLTADPRGQQISEKTTTQNPGGLRFQGDIPGVFDVFFAGIVDHNRYSGGWRTPNLASLVQQPLRLYVLLCSGGGWVASIQNVATSCADHTVGDGVIAWGQGSQAQPSTHMLAQSRTAR